MYSKVIQIYIYIIYIYIYIIYNIYIYNIYIYITCWLSILCIAVCIS